MIPAENWVPKRADTLPDCINISHVLPPWGMASHPNMPGSKTCLHGFAEMINSKM
jgi:hypothetical protein